MAELALFLHEKIVSFEARRIDVCVEGLLELGFGGVEGQLEGHFSSGELVVESGLEFVSAACDVDVEGFPLLVYPFLDEFEELLIDCVLACLVGEARARVGTEIGLLGVDPSLKTRVERGNQNGK
jgi:hypothetical protein